MKGGVATPKTPPLDPPRAVMCVMVSIILCRTTLIKLTCMLDHMVAMLPEVILADVSQEIKPVC